MQGAELEPASAEEAGARDEPSITNAAVRAPGARAGGRARPRGAGGLPDPQRWCHLSRLTDEHYGSPSNQLNLGHLDTMAGALEAAEEQRALGHLCIRGAVAVGVGVGRFPELLGCVCLSWRFSGLSFLRAWKEQSRTGKRVLE